MGSSAFSKEKPQIPHLLPRRRGGLSGEILDLRLDIEDGFVNMEGELQDYSTLQDEGVTVLQGAHVLNFSGSGVALERDPIDPVKVNVRVPGGVAGGIGNIQNTISFSHFFIPNPVGVIPAGRTVDKTVLQVLEAFDNDVQVSVGDVDAQGRFLTVNDSALGRVGDSFMVEIDYRYVADTTINVYFVGWLVPTQGRLRVVVYFS
jgi:hypothetical protein